MLSEETRNTLLYGQLQEGLCDNLMRSPAVSGACDYQELCLSAKTEEKRQEELLRRQKYRGQLGRAPTGRALPVEKQPIDNRPQRMNNVYPLSSTMSDASKARKCWKCKRVGHLAKDCPARVKQESTGHTVKNPKGLPSTSETREHRPHCKES